MKDKCKRILNCGGKIPQRVVLALMLVAGVVNLFTMRICLSVAIVRMVKPPNATKLFIGDFEDIPILQNKLIKEDRFDWDQTQQGLVLSSFYWGYLLSHLPGGYMADRFGGKYTLLFGVGSTTITTLLSPVVTRHAGYIGLIVLRVIMGLGEGVTFPAITVMLAKWAPPKESSRIGAGVLAASQLGSVVASTLSGLMLANFAWDYTFYLFGILGSLWCLSWLLMCYSVPKDHPFITEKELDYLSQTVKPKKKVKKVPWLSILKSVPVWAVIIGEIGHDWGFYMIVTDLPKYLHDVLHISVKLTGFYSALPALVMWLTSLAVGFLADYLISKNKVSVLNVRRWLTLIAAAVPACGLLGAALVAGSSKTGCIALFTIGMAGMAGYYPGMRVNPLDITRNYAGTVMALSNGLGAVAGIMVPIIVGCLTPHGTNKEWLTAFIITFFVLVISGIIYFFTAKAVIQKWDLQGDETPPIEAADAKDTADKETKK